MSTTPEPVGLIRTELEVPIEAPVDTVWKTMIEDIGSWWHEDFYFTPKPNKLVLEPQLGGRLYETSENGAGLVWGNVVAIVPGRSITFGSPFAPPYSGPGYSTLHLAVEPADNATLFRLQQSFFGHVHDGMQESLGQGWKLLFETGLKAFAEKHAS